MFGLRREIRLFTERLILRPPRRADFPLWARARRESRAYLTPWEPTWAADHLSRRAFLHRVRWSNAAIRLDRAFPFLLFSRESGDLIGAITLDNIRRGPAQTATLGYWTAEAHARRGYMREALNEVRRYAFDELDLSRLEAGCLPENAPSRALLETAGFAYLGHAPAYLKINGAWRDHVLYAALREDRAPGA